MRIIISPAKKMRIDTDTLVFEALPQFMKDTEHLSKLLKKLSYEEARELWKCNDKIATYNYQLLKKTDLYSNLTPALLAYEGIQYSTGAGNWVCMVCIEFKN
ncbi:peroxide stress protein YaaA [Anaerocolumna sp. AGMB13020]|uniref:peroxide stress protein YaaA n=1 Tax=Anaerocolumna sp. AGMB13020 TaxID=3081750 RepID=UPI002953E44D|nr:peroxide stress protein YaaA [Anaerocolumna sp. AGMB13020]WOO38105.1 peroxide stress protein YaaA [Anaerocolumna sp. AGMB13020]